MKPVKTGRKQSGRFQPGQSGNPAGRPKGARNKATIAAQVLLEGEAEDLTRKAVELALEGDVTALRLCLERLVPVARESPIAEPVSLPAKLDAASLPTAMSRIIKAVARGSLPPSQGERLTAMLQSHAKALELAKLAERVAELEAAEEARKEKARKNEGFR